MQSNEPIRKTDLSEDYTKYINTKANMKSFVQLPVIYCLKNS